MIQEEAQIIQEFALTIRQGLQLAASDFEAKRKILDLLDMQATIVVENEVKVVYAKCRIGDATMTITSKTIDGSVYNQHFGFNRKAKKFEVILTIRFVLE